MIDIGCIAFFTFVSNDMSFVAMKLLLEPLSSCNLNTASELNCLFFVRGVGIVETLFDTWDDLISLHVCKFVRVILSLAIVKLVLCSPPPSCHVGSGLVYFVDCHEPSRPPRWLVSLLSSRCPACLLVQSWLLCPHCPWLQQ